MPPKRRKIPPVVDPNNVTPDDSDADKSIAPTRKRRTKSRRPSTSSDDEHPPPPAPAPNARLHNGHRGPRSSQAPVPDRTSPVQIGRPPNESRLTRDNAWLTGLPPAIPPRAAGPDLPISVTPSIPAIPATGWPSGLQPGALPQPQSTPCQHQPYHPVSHSVANPIPTHWPPPAPIFPLTTPSAPPLNTPQFPFDLTHSSAWQRYPQPWLTNVPAVHPTANPQSAFGVPYPRPGAPYPQNPFSDPSSGASFASITRVSTPAQVANSLFNPVAPQLPVYTLPQTPSDPLWGAGSPGLAFEANAGSIADPHDTGDFNLEYPFAESYGGQHHPTKSTPYPTGTSPQDGLPPNNYPMLHPANQLYVPKGFPRHFHRIVPYLPYPAQKAGCCPSQPPRHPHIVVCPACNTRFHVNF